MSPAQIMEKNFMETLKKNNSKDLEKNRYQMYLNVNANMNVNQYLKQHPKYNQVM